MLLADRAVGGFENSILDSSTKRGWSPAEDAMLLHCVELVGPHRWAAAIAPKVPGRTGKQCRDRYMYHLAPHLDKSDWDPTEDLRIMDAVAEHGTAWAKLVQLFPGRTDNGLKNRWNTLIRKEQRRGVRSSSQMLHHTSTPSHDGLLPSSRCQDRCQESTSRTPSGDPTTDSHSQLRVPPSVVALRMKRSHVLNPPADVPHSAIGATIPREHDDDLSSMQQAVSKEMGRCKRVKWRRVGTARCSDEGRTSSISYGDTCNTMVEVLPHSDHHRAYPAEEPATVPSGEDGLGFRSWAEAEANNLLRQACMSKMPELAPPFA